MDPAVEPVDSSGRDRRIPVRAARSHARAGPGFSRQYRGRRVVSRALERGLCRRTDRAELRPPAGRVARTRLHPFATTFGSQSAGNFTIMKSRFLFLWCALSVAPAAALAAEVITSPPTDPNG